MLSRRASITLAQCARNCRSKSAANLSDAVESSTDNAQAGDRARKGFPLVNAVTGKVEIGEKHLSGLRVMWDSCVFL
jgi:hypothetical protein